MRVFKKRKVHFVSYILAFVLFIIPFWGIRYTSDWEIYSHTFENIDFSRDLAFSILSFRFYAAGYEYQDLFRFHIILIGLCFLNLSRIIKCRPLFVIFILLIFYYVQLGNQIRYYIAYPLIIYASYLLYNRKWIIGLLITIIALTFHKSVLFLLLCYIGSFSFIKGSETKQNIFLISTNLIIAVTVVYINKFDEQYEGYQTQVASLLGSCFNILPLLLIILFVLSLHKRIKKLDTDLYTNRLCQWLYCISIGSSVFILGSLKMQILAHRFISPLLPIWVAYFLYVYKNSDSTICQIQAKRSYVITLAFFFVWKFVITPLLGFDSYLYEMWLMLDSYQI